MKNQLKTVLLEHVKVETNMHYKQKKAPKQGLSKAPRFCHLLCIPCASTHTPFDSLNARYNTDSFHTSSVSIYHFLLGM